jgi:pyruvate dehydrogenase E1 component alpha subunit
MSREHLAAASGIVGAAGPLAVGFGLSAKALRPGKVALAFFGDGAANQGMLLESFNLAFAWSAPVVFVCKDNGWAITTRSGKVTGGDLLERARAFGLAAESADGLDAEEVHRVGGRLIGRARRGKGPGFLLTRTSRLDGHFLGDPLLRMARKPIAEGGQTFGRVIAATVSSGGGGLGARAASVAHMLDLMRRARGQRRESKEDPLVRCRRKLSGRRAEIERIDARVQEKVDAAVRAALEEVR